MLGICKDKFLNHRSIDERERLTFESKLFAWMASSFGTQGHSFIGTSDGMRSFQISMLN